MSILKPPAFVTMPTVDRTFTIERNYGSKPYGSIRCGGPCRDDYARIVSSHDRVGQVVTLQRAAMESYAAASAIVMGTGLLIPVSGSHRTCALQRTLHASAPSRFADPDASLHCRGLAVDVSQSQPPRRLAAIAAELRTRRWYQARPTDEPWHYSFGGRG